MSALGARLKAARWVGAGLADQIVIAIANAGLTLLGLWLVQDTERAGALILTVGVGYAVIGLGRAFVGEVLLASVAREQAEDRRELVRHGLTAALTIGVCASVLLFAIWAVWPTDSKIDLSDLVYLAAFMPVLLLHDAARYTYLAERTPANALQINLAYAGTQFSLIGVFALSGWVDGPMLIVAWGLGACAGVTLFCLRSRHVPWGGQPGVWIRKTRFLSGWFTATAVIAQVHGLAIDIILTARISKSALAGYSLVQKTMLQPVQNVNQVIISLLVPRLSRLTGAAVVPTQRVSGEHGNAVSEEEEVAATMGGPAAAAALRRQVLRLAVVFTALGTLMVVVGAPIGAYLLSHFDRYPEAPSLALPVLLQGAVYLVQAPFTAALRGMHRARSHFAQYAIYATGSIAALFVGAQHGGLEGAAWGLAIGSVIGLAASIALYLMAGRWLATTTAERPFTAPETKTELV